MIFAIPREIHPGERRVPLLPVSVTRLVKLGAEIVVESGLGVTCYVTDADYQKAGARVIPDRKALLSTADVVLRLRKPPIEEIDFLKKKAVHISFLDPFNEKELVQKFADREVSAISMEMVPRSTRAQKLDVLSSQASLAGYAAVITAASSIPKVFPMMSTPAGTIMPARVFVIGAGVAGLQAIATAKRLGAVVEAFDTRPVVEEQVKSLGGRFVKIDIGETGQTKEGYAKELTPEQIEKQRQGMKKLCVSSDVVITTALVFGKKAPRIVTADMVAAMKPGSVIVDLAVESGGNVEGSKANEEIEIGGVKVFGFGNLPSQVCVDASLMYGNNLYNFVEEFWDKEAKSFCLRLDDEIIKGCLITHEGKIWKP